MLRQRPIVIVYGNWNQETAACPHTFYGIYWSTPSPGLAGQPQRLAAGCGGGEADRARLDKKRWTVLGITSPQKQLWPAHVTGMMGIDRVAGLTVQRLRPACALQMAAQEVVCAPPPAR
jgi:hypothetical protein